LLRFLGVTNVAIWFGGSVFYTFAVSPAFFSPEMSRLLGETYSGVVGQMVAERYYLLQYWCGTVALVHLLAEWVLLSRPLYRLATSALISAFVLGLLGGMWFQPRIIHCHRIAYGRAGLFTPAQKTEAAHAHALWQGFAHATGFLALAGVFIYGWRIAQPSAATRFIPTGKFRG
jgi:hypothetical protein